MSNSEDVALEPITSKHTTEEFDNLVKENQTLRRKLSQLSERLADKRNIIAQLEYEVSELKDCFSDGDYKSIFGYDKDQPIQ